MKMNKTPTSTTNRVTVPALLPNRTKRRFMPKLCVGFRHFFHGPEVFS